MKNIFFFLSFSFILTLSACTSSKDTTAAVVSAQINTEPYISQIPSAKLDESKALTNMAFGSCANQDWPQPMWTTISKTQPELFLFMGDNVYASNEKQKPIVEQYRKLDRIPEYKKIRAEVPFLVTWDDHDFGQKDGGADFQGKDLARRDFLNYWHHVENSLPQKNGGIYHSKIIGPPKKAIQVIMLDTRYYRSPVKEEFDHEGVSIGFVATDELKATVLGDEQWKWLEAELKKPADVRFVISSIQLIGDENKYEKWGNFPKERQRFFDLLKKTKTKNVVVLSGDRHMGIMAKENIPGWGTLYDITASSINRPSKYTDNDSHNFGKVYSKENFGVANIDWKKRFVRIELRDIENNTVNKVKVKLR